jgi:hypothetical protein
VRQRALGRSAAGASVTCIFFTISQQQLCTTMTGIFYYWSATVVYNNDLHFSLLCTTVTCIFFTMSSFSSILF